MYSAGTLRGDNRQGGGMVGGNGLSAGNKFVMGNSGTNMGFAFYELSAVGATYQGFDHNTISSLDSKPASAGSRHEPVSS